MRSWEYYEKDISQCGERVVGNIMRKMYGSVVSEGRREACFRTYEDRGPKHHSLPYRRRSGANHQMRRGVGIDSSQRLKHQLYVGPT